MFTEKITFSLPCLKSLVASDTSCVYCKPNLKRTINLLPMHLHNLKQSIKDLLMSKVTTYDIELGGIILSYKHVKIYDCIEMNDEEHFTLKYIADVYIFTPQIGSILKGKINKKGRDILGCLVHSTFNVALPRPRYENNDESSSTKKWLGSKAYYGQTVTFTVVKLDFTGRLPYIRGEILSLENDEQMIEDGDSGMGFLESNDDDVSIEQVNKSKLKSVEKKRKRASTSLTLDEEDCPNKKRRKKFSTDEFGSPPPPPPPPLNESLSTTKRKHKKSTTPKKKKIIKEESLDEMVELKSKIKRERKESINEMENLSIALLKEAVNNSTIIEKESDNNNTNNEIEKHKSKHKKESKKKKSNKSNDGDMNEITSNLIQQAMKHVKLEIKQEFNLDCNIDNCDEVNHVANVKIKHKHK